MRNIRQLLVAFLMSAVVACGGGGSIGGGGTTTTPVYTLALSLSDAAGQAATIVSKAEPLTVKVKLAATNGGAISGKLVTFTLNDSSLASFNNGAGTAQTNASGEASIGLIVGTKSGAGMITATLASGEKAEITFSSAGDGGVVGAESNVALRLLKADGTVSNDLSFATPLTIEATFTSTKTPVAGQIIVFELSDTALAKFGNSTASAITDSSGIARLALKVGTKNGVGTITPSFAGQSFVPMAFNSAGDDPTGQAAVIALKLQTKAGVETAVISKDTPLDAVVQLTSTTGVPIADKQINFSINLTGLASFTNQTATARTDSNGFATIGLIAGGTNGTATLTATLDSDVTVLARRPFTSAGDGAVVGNDSNVVLRLLKADGTVGNNLSFANPLTLEATLTSSRVAVAGQIISFQLSDNALAKFSNETASAITDSNGVARLVLTAGTKNGVGTVTPVFAGQTFASQPFNSAGDNPVGQTSIITLKLQTKAGVEASNISKDTPLDAVVQLKSASGVPIADKQVNFSINLSGLASFSNQTATARTDANGFATIGLIAGGTNGTGTLTATLDSDVNVLARRPFTSAGDGAVVGSDSNVVLRLLKSDGAESNELSFATPLTLEATLTSTKVSVAGQIISFQLSDNLLAKFSNSTASAITDANGVARLVIKVGTKNGVGSVTPFFGGQAYASKAFNSAGDDPTGQAAIITLALQTKAGVAASQLSKDVPLDAVVVLKSATGVPVSDKQINFEINIAGLAYFGNQTATARTDATGTAKIGLTAGTTNGTGTLTASLDTDEGVSASRSFDSAGDGGPVTSDPVSSVLLQSDKLLLGSGSTDKVELTAIVKDVNQVLLKDSKVTFAVEPGSDAELEVVSSVTNNMGVATATLTSRNNLTLRDIVVSATAGSAAKKSALTIKVVGTDIQVVAPSAVVVGNAVDLSFDLVDSASKPIRNTALQLSSSLNNQFSDPRPVTDSSTGRAVVKYTAANSGTDVITVSALGVSKSISIVINSDAFGFVRPANEPAVLEIPLDTVASAKIKWTRNNSPMIAQQVTFATTRGLVGATSTTVNSVTASNNTDNAGEAEVFMKSEFSGFANISGATAGPLALQSQKLVEFIATVPDANRELEVQAFPAQLGVGEKAVVQAIVRDARNNPVKNQLVAFSLIDAAGGQLSPATAMTNSQGIASTEFLADSTTPGGGTSDQPKGLKISASLVSNSAIKGSTSIAVGNRTLFFRFATGNKIRSATNGTLYFKDFAVLITDSSGNPVANQQLNVSVSPNSFAKGRWFKSPIGAAFKSWVPRVSNNVPCLSEDVNKNGIIDAGEDLNGDRQLTPGNVVAVERTVTGGADGIAYFTLTYPKEMGAWVTVDVTVSGIAVGTENVYSRVFTLDYDGADTTKEESRPLDSPFGVDAQTDLPGNDATAFTTVAQCYN